MCQFNPPAQKPRSSLESLPVEVLQLIFLHSLEVNLPRASPHLAQALSNQLLYTWLIRLAFSSPNPGSRQGFFTPDFLPPPLDFWSISWEERGIFQTALLTCKWCTLPLLRKCQREYVHHAITRKCKDLIFAPSDQQTLDALDPRFNTLDACDKAPDGRKGKGDLVIPAQVVAAAATQDPPFRSIDRKLAIWLHFGAVQIREPNEVYYENDIFRLPASPILHPGRIPNKLLRGPWSSSQFEFLQLLAPDFYLDEDEHAAERSAAITTKLIRRRKIEPFTRLLRMYFRAANCRVPARWPLLPVHFVIIQRYADMGRGRDPFAHVVLEERWDDIPAAPKEELLRLVGD